MQLKWLSVLAIVALLLTRLPPSSLVSANDDDTVTGEDVGDDMDNVAVDEEAEEEESDIDDLELGPTKLVDVTAIFPDFPTLEIPAGAIVTAVVGLDNKADSPFVVSSIEGSLGAPFDYTQSFQNFTAMPIELRVDAGQQATFTYKFRPSDRFEPRDFALAVVVNLKDQSEGLFVNTAFNQTITLTDPESDVSSKAIFGYILFAAVGVLAFLYSRPKPATKPTKQAAKRVETGAGMVQEDEWLADTNVVQPRRRKRSERKN
ncbi:hypothetical protein PTSG_05775 [Salpingoeca rosetta]|uniref:Uncharacterized protein n=1 Tax=Salpingoeca rosetta (strain ATCC 50818 / BSB-021) TaxID=946362 RepID=F2UB70_SALR5|nr:uncharacterized protein PTSG_05775 [Salpingoeca rosetta]EGD74083.1 hypothetical protein PTSG_05775 [Salpingoeca rosetta]|eukprot:XP_004993645.1 hypothetical protein PTSG_05775 [Salpingoeca rosetta]